MLNVYQAVMFDLDGTLIDSKINFPRMKAKSIQFLERSGVKPGLLTKNMLNQEIEHRAKMFLRKEEFSTDTVRTIFREVTSIMNAVELEAIERIQLYYDVPETLQTIQRFGLKIGILTRGCREYAEKAVKKVRLQRCIDAIVARDDVSNPKPDPEHPRQLLKILKVKPSETLLVGDTITDIRCAHNVRMKSAWLNREGTRLPIKTPKPDYKIHSLIEVLDIIKR